MTLKYGKEMKLTPKICDNQDNLENWQKLKDTII